MDKEVKLMREEYAHAECTLTCDQDLADYFLPTIFGWWICLVSSWIIACHCYCVLCAYLGQMC